MAGTIPVISPESCATRTGWHGWVGRCIAVLLVLLAWPTAAAPPIDGRWELRIEGHQAFVFGEQGFGGGIRIPWEVVIQFRIENGTFGVGSGSARWIERTTALSAPPGWFDCRRVDGTYLDSNLKMHATPRIRFAAFPVAGAVVDGRVEIQPGYRPPGNYLAVTYRCETRNAIAENWFDVAERAKQVHGKRQDVETRVDGVYRVARVREVAPLPPERRVDLPLEDGWYFAEGTEVSERHVSYRLQRVD